ncbi:MAG: hypothetical protein DWQ04_32085 [Chloroflexi bacterium]|nr:MAG: hypothetical protein DWQ04_32085 [Chloroflexota bacterium]
MQNPPTPQDSSSPVPIQTIGIFLALTAVFLIALIISANRLSQHPRYQPGETSLIPRQWQVITDQEQTFTFNMPDQWEWVENRPNTPNQAFAQALKENEGVETAVSLFRRIDPKTEIKMFAIAPSDMPHPPILFVAKSQRMNQLSPTQLAAAIGNELSSLQQIELIDRPGAQQFVEFMIDLPIYSETWQCIYQYTNNEEAGYMLGGCAPQNNFGSIGTDLLAIQDSFQLLFR